MIRARIRPVSARRAVALREYAKLRRIWLAQPEQRFCRFPACRHRTGDVHHSRGRLGVLLVDVRFWIPLCRRHHDWVGQNPAQARELNLLCPVGSWNSPHRD